MYKILDTYACVLRDHLSQRFNDCSSIDPIELNKERFRVKGVFIAAVMFLKFQSSEDRSKIVYQADSWMKANFSSDNLFSLVIKEATKDLIESVDSALQNSIGVESLHIPTFYEVLLGIETGNEGTKTEVTTAKNYRNKLGSYYTPSDLAKTVTQRTIDEFLSTNYAHEDPWKRNRISDTLISDLSSLTFADFSCGGGNFLIEIISYFERFCDFFNVDRDTRASLLSSIAKNISAFDVDCLALEVAKLTVLMRIGRSDLYKEISNNFVHGNFLMISDFPINESLKVEVFSSGFIYHELLSIHRSRIGNYDIILGNPPWEKIRFEEKRFYALYTSTIQNNHFKTSRKSEIDQSNQANTHLASFSSQYLIEIEKVKKYLKKSPMFDLSSNGELNTYALFADLAIKLRSKRGVIGLVLKSAIVTSQANQKLFSFLAQKKLIIAIYDFINRKKIFDIDSRERFCFLLVGESNKVTFSVAMNLSDVADLRGPTSVIELPYHSLRRLNPLTGMLPNFSNRREMEFLLKIATRFPSFNKVYGDVRFGRIVHLTSHAEFISKTQKDDNLPIYEGKFFNQLDGRFSGFNGVDDEKRYGSKASSVLLPEEVKKKKNGLPESRFFIQKEKWRRLSKNHSEKFMLAWRSLTSATNTRTCIATVLPFIPASQSVQFLTTKNEDLLYLCGLFNSVVFDYLVKKKLNGIDLTQSVINQIPVPPIEQTERIITFNSIKASVKDHVSIVVSSILKDEGRLSPLFKTLQLDCIIDKSRFDLIRSMDLLFMMTYALDTDDIDLILSEFRRHYSHNDLEWFKAELLYLLTNNSVCTANSTTTFSPV